MHEPAQMRCPHDSDQREEPDAFERGYSLGSPSMRCEGEGRHGLPLAEILRSLVTKEQDAELAGSSCLLRGLISTH